MDGNVRNVREGDRLFAGAARPQTVLPDLPLDFERQGCVEWNNTTKALTAYLAALGVADPPRVARSINENFRTISDFLNAPDWKLQEVVGRRLTQLIIASHDLVKAMLAERVTDGPVVRRGPELISLLQAEIGFLPHERVMALYVDSYCRLMRIETIGEGSIGRAEIDRHRLFGCALNIGAAAFFLVHNHPSGVPKPSTADIQTTDELRTTARSLDLELLDHFIVARGNVGTILDFWREARFEDGPK